MDKTVNEVFLVSFKVQLWYSLQWT